MNSIGCCKPINKEWTCWTRYASHGKRSSFIESRINWKILAYKTYKKCVTKYDYRGKSMIDKCKTENG